MRASLMGGFSPGGFGRLQGYTPGEIGPSRFGDGVQWFSFVFLRFDATTLFAPRGGCCFIDVAWRFLWFSMVSLGCCLSFRWFCLVLQWCGGFSPEVFYVFWGTPRRDLLKSELVCVLSQELRQEEALSSSCTDNVARRTPRTRNRAEDDSPPSLAVVVDNYFQENRAKKNKMH